MLEGSFLGGVDPRKGRWRDAAAEATGVLSENFWTGRGKDALEVAYGTAASRPNATTVRDVWKQRHGRAAAPLLTVVAYRFNGGEIRTTVYSTTVTSGDIGCIRGG